MTGQELLIIFGSIGILLAVGHFFRKRQPMGKIPRIDEVASRYLGKREHIDPAKYYAVMVDTDPGIFFAYCEERRTPRILEFGSLNEAKEAAKDESVDPEGEVYGCVYRGRDGYLAIYNNGVAIN